MDAPREITAGEMLEKLAEEGISVTRHQLVRWHKRGLLPRPRTKKLGRAKGSETRYPMLALAQAYAIGLLHRVFPRDLDAIGWGLWCLGFPVETLVRRVLSAELDAWEQRLRSGYAAFESGVGTDPISRLTEGRAPPGFGAVRRRVGRNRIDTIGRMAFEMLLGRFDGSTYTAEDLDLAYDAVDAQLGGIDPEESVAPEVCAEAMTILSQEANLPQISSALADVPDGKLRLLRDEAQTLYRLAVGDRDAFVLRQVFLLWFAFRQASPSINAALQTIDKRILPTLQPTMLRRVAIEQRRRAQAAKKRGNDHEEAIHRRA